MGINNRFQYPLQFKYYIRKPHPLLANILGTVSDAERSLIIHMNYTTIMHRDVQKSFFQGTATLPNIKQNNGKSPKQEV